MKISKSKRQLAQLLIDAGVKEFPNGADWAAQGSTDLKASFYSGYKPNRGFGEGAFCGNYCGRCHDVQLTSLISNWYQTVLSRAEFDQIVAETAPDADGWIEWRGGECPVGEDDRIDVKFSDGDTLFDVDSNWDWSGDADMRSIIAYRLHKQEQAEPQYCESVTRSIPEPTTAPTLEQLAADYRNAKDYADRKQQEADAAKADADAKMKSLELAGEALGLLVSPITAKQEPELAITNWRDLQVGDEIEVFNFERPGSESRRKQELMSGPCVVMQADGGNVRIELKKNLPTKGSHWNATGVDACEFKFIRRP